MQRTEIVVDVFPSDEESDEFLLIDEASPDDDGDIENQSIKVHLPQALQ